MFKSLGNIRANPAVGLLFLNFEEPRRLRVNGTATVSADDAAMPLFPGAQLLVRVTPHHIFPNCPRYIPRMQMVEASPYRAASRLLSSHSRLEEAAAIQRRYSCGRSGEGRQQ